MKILWLINAPFPELCQAAGLPMQVKEGWIQGLYQAVKPCLTAAGIKLSVAFPQFLSQETITGKCGECSFYGFYKEEDKPYKYNDKVTERLKAIVAQTEPDVVHIAGTEYDHACSMVRAFKHPDRTVVSIQGMTSVYAGHYMADLPVRVRNRYTFRDILKHDNLVQDQKKYVRRGKLEEEVIRSAGYIIGRTDWDRACTRRVNPKAQYYHCGEILRPSFYNGDTWSYDNCKRHSIFVSQGYYPIKGLHYMIEALADIRSFYPDVKLYVAGNVTLNDRGIQQKLRQKNYQRYLAGRIDELGLRPYIEFLPALNEEQMEKQYLKSNVFVSPSSIENSPNSLGEAMKLGVPCVSSMVGGVASMLVHEKEGFLYQHDAAYMLAHYVMRIFEECELDLQSVQNRCNQAMSKADMLFDREKNGHTMLDIYKDIYNRNK